MTVLIAKFLQYQSNPYPIIYIILKFDIISAVYISLFLGLLYQMELIAIAGKIAKISGE